MDPNETLGEIRKLVANFEKSLEAGDAAAGLAYGAIVGHVEELDEWLARGGFLPTAWQVNR